MPGVQIVTRDTIWPSSPSGHLAVTRQTCTSSACSARAVAWSRCPSCRTVIARCGEDGGSAAVLDQRASCCRGSR